MFFSSCLSRIFLFRTSNSRKHSSSHQNCSRCINSQLILRGEISFAKFIDYTILSSHQNCMLWIIYLILVSILFLCLGIPAILNYLTSIKAFLKIYDKLSRHHSSIPPPHTVHHNLCEDRKSMCLHLQRNLLLALCIYQMTKYPLSQAGCPCQRLHALVILKSLRIFCLSLCALKENAKDWVWVEYYP